jgi:RHS repeat-associated protein
MCVTDPGASATIRTQLTLATCGSAGQTWTTAGTGATPPGRTQNLTYDAEGRTASVSTPSGTSTNTSKYLYDADGNLLEQTSTVSGTDKTRILYLFGGTEQITLNVSAKTWTGLRNYTGPDGTTITRSSSGTVTYQVANAQGTATTAIDASTLAVTRRSYDPYGNPRGTKPTTWVAADENHGYLGQPTDPTTGLNLLGARNYDPLQGRFLTPDPIFQAGDPNQMGGYTYAADNPASASDPTGNDPWANSSMNTCAIDCGVGEAAGGLAGTSSGATTASPSPSASPSASPGTSTPGSTQTPTPTLGETPCQPADFGTSRCESESEGIPATLGILAAAGVAVGVYACVATGVLDCAFGAVAGTADAEAGGSMLLGVRVIIGFAGGLLRAGEEAADSAAADSSALAKADKSSGHDPAANDAQAKSQAANDSAAEPSKPTAGTSGTKPAEASSPAKCSFSPDTPVLMDTGKTKPIGHIKTGDKVEAANPKTGKEAGGRTVQHVWINHDHDLLDVTVATGHGHTAIIHTTSNHPFWDGTTHTWTLAGKLHAGHLLASTAGHRPVVLSVKLAPGTADRYNLTVHQLHTYYVLAGTTPILVHNTGTGGNLCTVPGHAHVQSRVDDLTDAAGAGAGYRTMGGLHADIPGAGGGIDLYAVGARADLSPGQFGELADLGDTEFGFRVPQPARLVAREDLWHAEVKLFNEGAGILQLQPRFLVVSRPICPACEDFLTRRGATLTSATTAEW